MLLMESSPVEDKEELIAHIVAIIIGILFSFVVLLLGAYFIYVVIRGRRLLISEKLDSHVEYSHSVEGLKMAKSRVTVISEM